MKNALQESFLKLMEKNRRTNKTKSIRDIGSKKTEGKEGCVHKFKCEKFTYLQQGNNPEKYFILERWNRINMIGSPQNKQLKIGDIEYRIAYYIVSRKPETKRKGKWVFGQYSPIIGHEDLFKLINLAKLEKTIVTHNSPKRSPPETKKP